MGKKRKQEKKDKKPDNDMLEWSTKLRSLSKAINEFCDMIVDMGNVDPVKFTEVVKKIKFLTDTLPKDTGNTLKNFYNDLEKAKEGHA